MGKFARFFWGFWLDEKQQDQKKLSNSYLSPYG
jgi:hypothetical protein